VRIGLLTASASRRAAGVWGSVAQLGKALAAHGLDVEIFGLADRCSGADCAGWDGPPLRLHDVFGSPAFGYAPRLARSLHGRGPSLLHANGLWMYPSLASFRWSRRARRPYLIAPHGMLDPWAVANSAWKKRLVGWWFENAHLAGAACLHALTAAEARALRSYGLRNPICVLPNGVDPPEDEPRPHPDWAAETGGRRVLLFLGRLHPKKGLLDLIRAWAEVQADRPAAAEDWMLVIAGWDQGGHAATLRRLIEELGAADTVRLVGPQFGDQRSASFTFADAFALPSLSEGLPVAVLEAWSYGLPVLMTEACNLPEGFAAGAALPIGPGRAGIAAGLRRLLALSDAERRAIGERGRALVRARFSWPSVGERMATVYAWVLGGGAPPACVLTD
jgi:poly(glycerol-phosphate) alpha-glucosyltransferase